MKGLVYFSLYGSHVNRQLLLYRLPNIDLQTLMYITAVPNRHSPPAILLRESFRDGRPHADPRQPDLLGAGAHRALRRASRANSDGLHGGAATRLWPYLRRAVCAQAACRGVGLLQVLGSERQPNSVLFLSVAASPPRVTPLRRSAGRPAHAVAETLGLKRFDEDDLYDALDRLVMEQEHPGGGALSLDGTAARWCSHGGRV